MESHKKHFRKKRLIPYIILAVVFFCLGTLSGIFLNSIQVFGENTANDNQTASSPTGQPIEPANAWPSPSVESESTGGSPVGKEDMDPSANQTYPTADKIPEDAQVLDVPYISQEEGYPSGCEMVSSTMLLHYYGYSITVDELIDGYLETVDFYWEDGLLYGADPSKAFAGDPQDSWSCGCYAPVVEETLNRVLSEGLTAVDTTGKSLSSLEKYIDTGVPVLVWVSIDMQPTYPGDEWVAVDSGETIQWVSPEHCMVLIGYDEDHYYFNDPYESNGLVSYDKDLVEERFEELGYQSVVIQ